MITSVMRDVCNNFFEGEIEWYAFSCDEVDVLCGRDLFCERDHFVLKWIPGCNDVGSEGIVP